MLCNQIVVTKYLFFFPQKFSNVIKFYRFPVIITIELHCSVEQQKVMADLIKKHLGGIQQKKQFYLKNFIFICFKN